MRVLRADFHALYHEALLKDSKRTPVVVLVSAADCDSCASFRLLRALLKADNVPFSAYAVRGYEELQRRAAELAAADPAAERMLILLNCGGTEHLTQLLELDAAPNTRCLVVDSHRPLHLANVAEENGRVFCLVDEREAVVGGGGAGDSLPPHPSEAAEEEEEEEEEEEAAGAAASARAAQRAAAVAYYSRGSFYGRPSACVLFELAYALGREGAEGGAPAWLAACGLTDLLLHGRMSGEEAAAAARELAGRVAESPLADASQTLNLEGGAGGGAAEGEGVTVRARAYRRISFAPEYRLPLLRHWNLYEALQASPYVAARLQTWREGGRRTLDRLLAEAGLPLSEARQRYIHMSPAALAALGERLGPLAPQYGLSDLTFLSFSKQHGYKLDVSASDVVYGITAILSQPAAAARHAAPAAAPAAAAADAQPSADDDAAAFWTACDALSEGHWEALRAGIAHAQRLAACVSQAGGRAVAQHCVANAGAFRLLNLAGSEGGGGGGGLGGGEAALLAHPMAALQLALFVQEAVHVSKPRSAKPLLLVSPAGGAEEGQRSLLLVGVASPPKPSDAVGNRFALCFRSAATAVGAPFVHDAFEAAVLRLAEAALPAFLEQLASELQQLPDS